MAVVKCGEKWRVVVYRNGQHFWKKGLYKEELDAKQAEIEILRAVQQQREQNNIMEMIENLSEKTIQRKGLKLDAAWAVYMQQPGQAEKSPRTLASKRIAWNAFTKWLKGEYAGVESMHEVTRDMAIAYSNYLSKRGIEGQTLNNNINCVRSVFKVLAYAGGMRENPFSVVLSATAAHKSYRCFTLPEIKALLKKAPGEWKTAITVGLYTGLRWHDVAHLQWNCIDFSKRLMTVTPAKTVRFKKKLDIPLHDNLIAHLQGLEQDGDYVMPGLAAGYGKKDVADYFSSLLVECKIVDKDKGRLGFHSLRHTFVTRLQDAGASREVARDLVGHGSPEVTKIYTHAVKPLRKAIDKLPDISKGKTAKKG